MKYAQENLTLPQSGLLVYLKGEKLKNVSDEEIQTYGWTDLVGDEPPKTETEDLATGAGFKAEDANAPGASKRAAEKTNPGASPTTKE